MNKLKERWNRSFAAHVFERWTIDLVKDVAKWLWHNPWPLLIAWVGYWTIKSPNESCDNFPAWMQWLLYAALFAVIVFALWSLWHVRKLDKMLVKDMSEPYVVIALVEGSIWGASLAYGPEAATEMIGRLQSVAHDSDRITATPIESEEAVRTALIKA